MSSELNSPIKLLYVTCKDIEQARSIGRAIVTERLAACVNIIPGMESIYPWEGKIDTSTETLLIIKTTEKLSQTCIDRVISLHCYEIPCVLNIDVLGGNGSYLNWIRDQVY